MLSEKAAKEEKRKVIAEKFPKIDFLKALKNGSCHHYVRYNAHVRSGKEWSEKLCDPEMWRLKKCEIQIIKFGDRSGNNVIKIQRYPIKLSNSRLYFDIVKNIKKFIATRFKMTFSKRDKAYKTTLTEFKAHISNTVDKYSSYVLIDKVKNSDYYLGMKKDKMNPDKECDRIVCVMVCELDIIVGPMKVSSSLIHYLCTYPTMQGRKKL